MLEQPARAEAVLRGRLDERFGTGHLGGLNLDAREPAGNPAGQDPRLRLGVLRRADGRLPSSRSLARIPADAEAASEFRYRNPIVEPDTLYVAVSQSGETIDTLLAVQEIQRKGGRCIGLVNVVGSAIAREVDGGIYLHSGPEVAVASTKALTNMFLGFAMLAVQTRPGARPLHRRRPPADRRAHRDPRPDRAGARHRARVPRSSPRSLAEAESLFFVGRVRGFPVAREGAQKFKEITYRHAEAYQTSELKHGPLALISSAVPTVAIVPDDEFGRAQRRGAGADRRSRRPAHRGHPRERGPRRPAGAPDRRTGQRARNSTRSC
ncbi:SIS domain-containing protein [Nocardioides convexus]|uniref:SIS domain-containing protein n=1 Tax=Nocardioides convexus TaxID=2712224 RepID=UPI002418AFD4|nr:SIS domain-containing protein [Nocardioides convexus]